MAVDVRLALPAIGAVLLPLLAGCLGDSVVVGTPHNPVERALALCGIKTEKSETACLRQALVDGRLGPEALAGVLPGCRVGKVCSIEYRTRDRQGLLSAYATDHVADWRVTFDLTRPDRSAADIPIKVQQI